MGPALIHFFRTLSLVEFTTRGGAALLCLCLSFPSIGQSIVPEKSISVRDRPRPEYEPAGIHLGGIRVSPRLTFGEAYNDNLFATPTGKVSDLITRPGGEVSMGSEGRIPWSVFGGLSSRLHADNSREDYTEWQSGGSIGHGFGGDVQSSLSTSLGRNHELRGDPTFPVNAAEPLRFDTRHAQLDVTRELPHGRLALRANLESFDYADVNLTDGTRVDQDFRDRRVWGLDLRSDFAIGPSTGVFVRATHQKQQYRSEVESPETINRDAATNAVYGGTAIWLSNLMRGHVAIGVLDVDNADPRQKDTRSLALDTRLEFYITQIMTATLSGQRSSGAADLERSASYLATSGDLKLDYEVRRNVILSASYSYSRREYSGISTVDTIEVSQLSAQWFLNRHLRINCDFTHEDRDLPSGGAGQTFGQSILEAKFLVAW